MRNMEHEEWLENEKARKAAKRSPSSPIPPKKVDDRKKDGPDDTEFTRSWVID